MLTSSRLILARKRRRMTLSRLSQESGVSVRSLTAFENGHKEPSPETLDLLASALDLPVSFFSASEVEEIEIDALSFRALSKMSAIDRDSARAAGRLAIEINQWMEERFTLPKPNVPTLPHLSPEEAAERVRALWGLGEAPIPNMVHLLESHGVRVFSLAADCASVDAFSLRWKEKTPFIYLNLEKSGERGRFDAAHELGHLVLHAQHRIPHGPEAENEAQQFASAFLMPRSGILAQMLHNADAKRILSAKKKWKVAAVALAYRLKDLGLVTDWRYRTTVKHLSQMGYRRGEPDGIIRESSQLLGKVFSALRASDFPTSKMADDLNITVDELNRHVFGLVPLVIDGEQESSYSKVRPNLRLVSG
ncbi:XRE family transcriptional regulator [Streptomyces malaysiensis subsp. malaysiensis]|uniref:XRE family transcriptional regulator n=2 Tax=Streptomyces malaysiensis TaxID=92644 RepID=A0ABX6WAH9_STRMQ|nr:MULTISPECIES: XRE family transcriptional regulator [Streptomyces]QPI57366.1 XRE family transcriptional regulator [Streptomyces solisilvae]